LSCCAARCCDAFVLLSFRQAVLKRMKIRAADGGDAGHIGLGPIML
jgi:hypothetical protein